jgi:hypothetical protein
VEVKDKEKKEDPHPIGHPTQGKNRRKLSEAGKYW